MSTGWKKSATSNTAVNCASIARSPPLGRTSGSGLGRAKTPERLERVERPPPNYEWQSPDLRQKPQVDGSRRIRFPSVNTLLEFSHNQGQRRAFNGCAWPASSLSLVRQIADRFGAT